MRTALILLVSVALAACADDSNPTTPPVDEGPAEVTVAAATDWAFVSLGEPATVVTVDDRGASEAWDMAFLATSVMLNGGDAGPAGVDAHCICQNAGASDAQVTTFTDPEVGLPDFEAVTAASVPADEDAWRGDDLDPAIEGWWSYDPANHVVSAEPDAVWKLRLSDGTAYAKLHVVGIDGPTQQHAGRVTLEYAVQPGAGEPFGEVRRVTLDAADGLVSVDLRSGAVAEEGWDVALDGYDLRVNSGVSGDGEAGALRVEDAFDAMADAGDAEAFLYAADAFGGVFTSGDPGAGWYRYNIEGNHQIWPTYNVYLVRRGSELWKVQLVGYYSDAGDPRHITLRYERLED